MTAADPRTALQEQIGAWFDYHLRRTGADHGTCFDYQVHEIFGTRGGFAQRRISRRLWQDGVLLGGLERIRMTSSASRIAHQVAAATR